MPCVRVGGMLYVCHAATVQHRLRKTGWQCQTTSYTFMTLRNKCT